MFIYKHDFSIVMGYYNRKSQIINTLNNFQQNYIGYKFEVIIVDDNSSPEHRLDDLLPTYSFPIKHIVITEDEKGDRINPCITYNRGIRVAEGKYLIIQNPECMHVGNILQYVENNLTENQYIAFSCFNVNNAELSDALVEDINLINDRNFREKNARIMQEWYNHPVYRPVHYHFCAAIYNDNIKMIGGFDENFANGHSYDDNEILLSIEKNLKLEIKTIPPESCFVIHQWHSRDAENRFTQEEFNRKLIKNKTLYHKYVEEHNRYHFNFPKLLHLYWDGSKLSYLNFLTVLSFRQHHFGWKINIFCPVKRNENISWVTHEQKKQYIGEDYFNRLKELDNVFIHTIDTDILPFKYKDASEVIKSDYFRLYVLNRYGGLWSDFDIIYTNNVEQYYNDKELKTTKNMIIYNYQSVIKYYPVGLFLANKSNSILKVILKYIDQFYDPKNYQCLGCAMFQNIFNYYDKNESLKAILNEMSLRELLIDHADCYLKIKWNQLDLFYKSTNIEPDTYENDKTIFGLHWFNGADASKEYCNNLDLSKLKEKDSSSLCLIDKFVKKYI